MKKHIGDTSRKKSLKKKVPDTEKLIQDKLDKSIYSTENTTNTANTDFQFEGQNIAEFLSQIRDSIDSNSKCLLRVAQEIRFLKDTILEKQVSKDQNIDS